MPTMTATVIDLTTYGLTVSEAAALLGVHPDTLRRWTDAGKVPCWTTPSGHRRYRETDLADLLPGAAS